MSWIATPEFLLLWGGKLFRHPLTERQLERYLNSAAGDPARCMIFTALQKEGGQPVGHIELGNIDPINRSASICRVLVGETLNRGRGIGQAMVHEVLHIAFDERKLHRVDLRVFDFNEEAIRCYERVGFRREGRFRDSHAVSDGWWSVLQMSILEHEWRDVSELYFSTEPEEGSGGP